MTKANTYHFSQTRDSNVALTKTQSLIAKFLISQNAFPPETLTLTITNDVALTLTPEPTVNPNPSTWVRVNPTP